MRTRDVGGWAVAGMMACAPGSPSAGSAESVESKSAAVKVDADAVDAEDVAAKPVKPAGLATSKGWRSDLAEFDRLRDSEDDAERAQGQAYGLRALDTLAAVSEDDPEYLEAGCTRGVRTFVPASSWERLVAAEAKRPLATGRAQYASLGWRTRRIENEWRYSIESATVSPIGHAPDPQEISFSPAAEVEDCARADRAYLWLSLILAWSPGRGLTLPAAKGGAERTYETAAQMLAGLYDAAVRDLGAKDPLLATLIDYGIDVCDDETRRSHGRSLCRPTREALEQSLALRKKGLGADHPLTNLGRVSLAGHLLVTGAEQDSEALFTEAAAVRPGNMGTVLALRALAGFHRARGEKEAAERSAAEAAALALSSLTQVAAREELRVTLSFHARLAAELGFYDKSIAAYQLAAEHRAAVSKYELGEVYRAAGKDAEAIAAYDADIAEYADLEAATPGRFADRQTIPLRAKIAVLEKLGKTDEVAAARERLAQLERAMAAAAR